MAKEKITCPECGDASKVFQTVAALGSHRRITHGVAGTSRDSRKATPKKEVKRAYTRKPTVTLADAVHMLRVKRDSMTEVIALLEALA